MFGSRAIRQLPLVLGAIVCVWMTSALMPQVGVGQERPTRESEVVRTESARRASVSDERSEVIEAFTEPYRDVSISAAEMGTIAAVHVREGDRVSAGDLLASLDDQVLQAALRIADASRDALGQIQSAEAEVEMRTTELNKLMDLRKRNHASQREVDRVETELRIAEARRIVARDDIRIKQLEYQRIEAQLRQKLIRSPIDGAVTDVYRDPGEFVSPADSVVVRVVQLDPLLIVFSVPLELRQKVKREQRVRLILGGGSNAAEGHVEYVSPTADASNTSIRVKVRLPNPDGHWQAGERVVLMLDSQPSSGESVGTPVARTGK